MGQKYLCTKWLILRPPELRICLVGGLASYPSFRQEADGNSVRRLAEISVSLLTPVSLGGGVKP